MNTNDTLEFNILFEDIPPAGDKKVVVVIGRFNPPTLGHYKVIEQAITFIKKHPELKLEALPVVMVIGNDEKHDALIKKISAAADKSKVAKDIEELKRNPLKVADRIKFMQSSGHANAAKIMAAPDAFKALEQLRSANMEPIAIVAGSDRVQKYVDLLDKYFLDANGNKIKHFAVDVKRDASASLTKVGDKTASTADTLDRLKQDKNLPTDLVSGSVARAAVSAGYEEEFANIVGMAKKPALAKQMFDKIHNVTKDL